MTNCKPFPHIEHNNLEQERGRVENTEKDIIRDEGGVGTVNGRKYCPRKERA